jgi:hypothetical protein
MFLLWKHRTTPSLTLPRWEREQKHLPSGADRMLVTKVSNQMKEQNPLPSGEGREGESVI